MMNWRGWKSNTYPLEEQELRVREQARFTCKLCGIHAPHAVLCLNEDCPTELLMYGDVSPMEH